MARVALAATVGIAIGVVMGAAFGLHAQEFVPWTTDDVYAAIADAAAETGVPEATLVRVIWCESKFNPYAVGRSGEQGLVQLHPRGELRTFFASGFADPTNPYEAVRFLAQRLAQGSRAWSCR
jgi:hypothetical protein